MGKRAPAILFCLLGLYRLAGSDSTCSFIRRPIMKSDDQFFRGYVECALWSSIDDHDQPMDSNYDYSDIAEVTREAMLKDCQDFLLRYAGLLDEYTDFYDYSYAGHDFWLTRNGHGAGFWDRDEISDALGEQLTVAAKGFGEIDLYVGDDGEVYQ